MRASTTTLLWGDVTLGHPLVGATIAVWSLDGRCLHEDPNATYGTGSFALRIPAALERLRGVRLVATGGLLRGRPFSGCVVRQIDRLRPGSYHRLHGLTTLVAAVRARRPRLSAARAGALVCRTLQWPADLDFTRALELPQCCETQFDPSAWLAQAQRWRDFGAFLDTLVADVLAGHAHPMRPALPLLRDLGGLGEWVFGGLASGMLSWAGGQALSGLLSLMGYQSSTEKQLDAITKKLEQMGHQLDDTQRTVHELEHLSILTLAQVTALATRLESAVGELKTDVQWHGEITALNAELSTAANTLQQAGSTITATLDDLQCFWKIDPRRIDDDVRRAARRRIDTLLAPQGGTLTALQCIHDALVGQISPGYLADMATLAARGAADEAQLSLFARALEQRMEFLLGVQVIGISMVFDAYLADTPHNPEPALAFRTLSIERLQQQLEVYLRALEMLAASRIDGPTAGEFNARHAQAAMPSLLAAGDRLVAKVSAALRAVSSSTPQPAACCVVLRLVNYPRATKRSLAAAAAVQLRAEAAQAQIAAPETARHDGMTAKDRRGVSVPYEMLVLRFGVPSGSYRIDPGAAEPPLLRPLDDALVATVDTLCPVASLGANAWHHVVLPTPVRTLALPSAAGPHEAVADALAADAGQRLHALDWHNARIVSFEWPGGSPRAWGERGTAAHQFDDIHGIATAPDGSLWVTDAAQRRLQHCDVAQHKVVGTLDNRFRALKAPAALAVGPQGWVYVADAGDHLCVFATDGRCIAEWGSPGSGPNQFRAATGLAVDDAGAVYVADPETQRVVKLGFVEQPRHCTLTPLAAWGRAGTGPGEFNRPVAVAVDRPARRVIVADQRNHRLQFFELDGRHVASWGNREVLAQPGALAIDPASGALYVAHGGGRIVSMLMAVRVSLDW